MPQSACAYPISRQVLGETMLEAHLEYKTNEWSTTGTSRTENGPAARSSSDQPTLCSSRREGPVGPERAALSARGARCAGGGSPSGQ